MIVDRIEAREHPLSHHKSEQSVEELGIIAGRDADPLAQKSPEGAALTKTVAVDSAVRPPQPDKPIGSPQLIDFVVKPPKLIQMLLDPTPHLLLLGFAQHEGVDRELSAELIEDHADQDLAFGGRQAGHGEIEVPKRIVLAQLLETTIADAQQSELFEIGLYDTPGAT